MIAWRAGIMNEKSAPCTIEEIKRCCHADYPSVYHNAEHEREERRHQLRALNQQLAINLVGERTPEQGHGEQRHGDTQTNDAENGAASGYLVGEVSLREHLHLRARHQEEHAYPEQREVEVAERLEGAPETCRKRLGSRRNGWSPGCYHLVNRPGWTGIRRMPKILRIPVRPVNFKLFFGAFFFFSSFFVQFFVGDVEGFSLHARRDDASYELVSVGQNRDIVGDGDVSYDDGLLEVV